MNERPATLESPVGPRARLDGREVDYFCGTSYFCLHGHPQVLAAACRAVRESGLGSATAFRTPSHVALEEELRAFLAVESATLLPSGYLAPLVLLQALGSDHDVVLLDSAAHYGEVDAAAACGKPVVRFRHLDADDLARQMARLHRGQRALVLTDGVFPSTGAIAPLADYAAAVARQGDGILCVDDAHAFGVLGSHGRGSLEHHGIDDPRAYACGTLSKAFGAAGGFLPGSAALRRKILNGSRVPAGASAPSAPAAAAAAAALRVLSEHPEMRQALRDHVVHLRAGLRGLGFSLPDSAVPIVHLAGRQGLDLRSAHARLVEEGIVTLHVPPHGYSDAPGVESLRIAVFSEHTRDQLDRLVDALRRAL